MLPACSLPLNHLAGCTRLTPELDDQLPDIAPPEVKRPVFARHAASLLVVRHTRAGPEILMGVRGAGHRFMPNRLVFPGGAVDRTDASAAVASEPDALVLAMLARRTRPRLARALAIAAARELEEETGLTLGTPPALASLDYLCRAVTPTTSPIRFNARFLIAPADAVGGSLADSHELQHVAFRPVKAAMREDLMLVTREVLHRLLEWLALPERDRRARQALAVFKGRRWAQE